MTPRDRELTDVGLAGPPRQYHFREDKSKRIRWERSMRWGLIDPTARVLGAIGSTLRDLFVAMFPTRWDRIGALVVFVAAVYIGGWVVPQLAGIDERPKADVAAGLTR